MDTVTIKKRLEFHTKRLDNLYVAYNKLLSGGVKATVWTTGNSHVLTSASSAMRSKMPRKRSMN